MQYMEWVQGSWNLSHVKQHSLKVFHNVLMYSMHCIVFLFYGLAWLLLYFSCLYSLTHYLYISICLSHTSHFSLNCVHFLTLSQLYFHSCSLLPLRFSQISLLACLPPSGTSFHLSRIFYSLLHFLLLQCALYTFFFTDASFTGEVCSEYLKTHHPLPLQPTCPSCSMLRSQTLEPPFWAHLMSSASWDTTAMYPYWSKVG